MGQERWRGFAGTALYPRPVEEHNKPRALTQDPRFASKKSSGDLLLQKVVTEFSGASLQSLSG